jgi:hypothetical protein
LQIHHLEYPQMNIPKFWIMSFHQFSVFFCQPSILLASFYFLSLSTASIQAYGSPSSSVHSGSVQIHFKYFWWSWHVLKLSNKEGWWLMNRHYVADLITWLLLYIMIKITVSPCLLS